MKLNGKNTGYDWDGQKRKFLVFLLDNESYGIEIELVDQIIGMQKITAVPHVPHYVKGIINVRGKIIPVIDMRVRFMRGMTKYTDQTSIVIANTRGMSIGLIVDQISDVISVNEEKIVEPPVNVHPDHQGAFLKNIINNETQVIFILDCNHVIFDGHDNQPI